MTFCLWARPTFLRVSSIFLVKNRPKFYPDILPFFGPDPLFFGFQAFFWGGLRKGGLRKVQEGSKKSFNRVLMVSRVHRFFKVLGSFRARVETDFGQTDFGQTECGVWCVCVCVCAWVLVSRFHGGRVRCPRDRPSPGLPKISLFFFTLPPQKGGPFVEFWWCLKRWGAQMCTFGVLWLSCEAPAAPKPPGFHTTAKELPPLSTLKPTSIRETPHHETVKHTQTPTPHTPHTTHHTPHTTPQVTSARLLCFVAGPPPSAGSRVMWCVMQGLSE